MASEQSCGAFSLLITDVGGLGFPFSFLSSYQLPVFFYIFSIYPYIFVTTVGGATPGLLVLGDMKSGLKGFDDQDCKQHSSWLSLLFVFPQG